MIIKNKFPKHSGQQEGKYSPKTDDHTLPLYSEHLTQVSGALTDGPQVGGKDNA